MSPSTSAKTPPISTFQTRKRSARSRQIVALRFRVVQELVKNLDMSVNANLLFLIQIRLHGSFNLHRLPNLLQTLKALDAKTDY